MLSQSRTLVTYLLPSLDGGRNVRNLLARKLKSNNFCTERMKHKPNINTAQYCSIPKA